MVTKLADGRGQITVKGHEITDEWEALVKAAAQRNGQSVAAFVATFTTEAAQKILKGQSAVPSAVPARVEDVADIVTAAVQKIADELRREQAQTLEAVRQQGEALERRAQEQTEALVAVQRQARRGRWR
jgi:uncharacterized protein (DUF1778 family)